MEGSEADAEVADAEEDAVAAVAGAFFGIR